MTLIVGHRGARNLWPENSLGGFRNLLGLAVEGVEFDVHLSDAGELLVIHDATLDRTTTGTGPVRALGRDRGVLLQGTSEPVPTLDEVLAIYVPTQHELHVELKRDPDGQIYPGLAGAAVARIDALGLAERVIMTSFDVADLDNVRAAAPHLRTLLSLNHRSAGPGDPREVLQRAEAAADFIAIEMAYLDEFWDIATAAIPLDRLGVWVPNSEQDLAHWSHRGLRQLTTDRPDLALAARRQQAELAD